MLYIYVSSFCPTNDIFPISFCTTFLFEISKLVVKEYHFYDFCSKLGRKLRVEFPGLSYQQTCLRLDKENKYQHKKGPECNDILKEPCSC